MSATDIEPAPAGLVFTDDRAPGIRRRGRTRFAYVDELTGTRIQDPAELERIRRIAIPPAWTEVWISRDANAHLQATGRDAKGRKQYRYHPSFRAYQELVKFEQLVPFGHRLGPLRAKVGEDLARPGLPRERVVALVVRLLEETLVRVGNEEYAKANGSFGLTTLRDRHAKLREDRLVLRFTGKHGTHHDVVVGDRRVARLVRRCQDLPGQVLLQYVEAGEVRPIRSSDVNDYLRDVTGLDVTAKTFRTWGATVMAATSLVAVPLEPTRRARTIALNATIAGVAKALHNTPAVCRRSYVHPRVVESFLDGTLAEQWAAAPSRAGYGLVVEERKLLHLLEEGSGPDGMGTLGP